MWIFTVNGFFTFVTDRKDSNYLWLRARMREHLEANFPGVTAEMHPGADYLWRAKVLRTDVADQIAKLVMESTVDSHFKDVMIRTAAKPKTGNLSSVMYSVWNGAAAWQEYAPYSKVPRAQEKTLWKGSNADRRPGTGQTSLPSYSYGGSAPTGARASAFDWDARDWGGTAAKDPALTPAFSASDDELDEWWQSLTDEERDSYLDSEETAQRMREEREEDMASASRAFGLLAADVLPAPRNRPGTRRQRRKGKKNRHNQQRTAEQQARFEQDRRDGKHGSEARNRQAFLDKHNGGTR